MFRTESTAIADSFILEYEIHDIKLQSQISNLWTTYLQNYEKKIALPPSWLEM